jgi:hypothetical protein
MVVFALASPTRAAAPVDGVKVQPSLKPKFKELVLPAAATSGENEPFSIAGYQIRVAEFLFRPELASGTGASVCSRRSSVCTLPNKPLNLA